MSALGAWLESLLGEAPRDLLLYERALTHGSHGGETYQRLEFLGDRVLGLAIAAGLYARYPDAPEGELSRRLNVLVSRQTCAEVGREAGVKPWLRLGKQAREDGASDSDNVLGDAVEALIGAAWLDLGAEAAERFIHLHWNQRMEADGAPAPRHPKSALQEWAASHNRRPPIYSVVDRSGPDHAPLFRVCVSLGSAGEAHGEGKSKQEAETAAAEALLTALGA